MSPKLDKGLVEVDNGSGKGKTSAALGLPLRAIGRGFKVCFVFFFNKNVTGEDLAAKQYLSGKLIIHQVGRSGFIWVDTKPLPKDHELARSAFELAKKVVESEEFDIIVLDEINPALDLGLINVDEVLRLIREKPPNVELVLTGRGAPKEIVEDADLVTDMVEVKHWYNKGISGRLGIEFQSCQASSTSELAHNTHIPHTIIQHYSL
nr:cob(I)yrinic acid a,c-diamide adenosyltransferase [Candidatus Njordarchaeota archaeon]